MAIQFPPVNPGDTPPDDGDKFTYIPTQTQYVFNKTENSWSIVTGTATPTPVVIGKLTAGTNIQLDPIHGDLQKGDVKIVSANDADPAEELWQRSNGVLSPKEASDEVQVLDNAGGAILINELGNVDDL